MEFDQLLSSGCMTAGERPGDEGKSLREEILTGLRKVRKCIPSKFLYDARGSRLFDEICKLDEYYPTRTESSIMQRYGSQMARCLSDCRVLVELGSGSSEKTRILLDHLCQLQCYLPLDISVSHLLAAADRMQLDYPQLEVHPIVCDFTSSIRIPMHFRHQPICTYFPGSTIGNLEPADALELLREIQQLSRERSGLLIGFDLQKETEILELAYNDARGVTAAFNLNLLHRINRELGADFDVDQFAHVAYYDPQWARVEIYIESLCHQCVVIAGEEFFFRRGERILTEYSHKYTVDGFAKLARAAGLFMQNHWTDERAHFAVAYLTTNGGE